MDYAVLLLILSSVAVGVTSAVVCTWSLRSRIFSLEDRVSIVEGVTTREVKIRAANERFKKPSQDDELIAARLALAQKPAEPAKPWWQTNLPRSYSG